MGWGQGGEMTQALYAHMNNKEKKFKSRTQRKRGHIFGQLWGSQVIPYYGPPRSVSSEQLSVSGIKGEEFNVLFLSTLK
jgi:hypothetical protein